MPGGFVCSASMKGTPAEDVRGSFAASQPLRKLFSKAQRAFYAEHAPDGLALDDLTLLGPIFVLKLKFAPKAFDRKLVAEMWLYPDDSRILELSTKCAPAEALRVADEARAFLPTAASTSTESRRPRPARRSSTSRGSSNPPPPEAGTRSRFAWFRATR